jgi:hypothetical protein
MYIKHPRKRVRTPIFEEGCGGGSKQQPPSSGKGP